MPLSPEIRIERDRVEVWQRESKLFELPVETLVQQILRGTDRTPACGVLPRYTRVWRERGDVTALALEIPQHGRTVRWIQPESEHDFGPRALYGEYYLAFPYIILLLVFRRGALSGQQQLYYRVAPMDEGEALLLPKLLNVAEGYGQRCWLCLQHLPDVAVLPWTRKIETILEHLFRSGFNRSAETHEGNSLWSSQPGLDPRLRSPESWQEASRQNPLFVLEVPWRSAEMTATEELERMTDQVFSRSDVRTTLDLVRLMRPERRRRAR